jgi:hypothetical protein
MNNRTWVVILSSVVVFAAAACGDDDDSGGAGTDGSGGSGGTSSGSGGMSSSGSGGMSSSGSGGMSSSGSGGMSSSGSGGMSGSGGASAPAPVACGTSMCTGGGLFRACCFDEATNTCGVQNMMLHVDCAPPAVADPKCPDRAGPMGRTSKGCCATDGVCGVFAMGSPCISLAGKDAGALTECGEGADAGL